MKTLKEIESAIAKQAAQVQAIVELATEEERELTADEQLLVDKIQGVGEEPGELDKLKAGAKARVEEEKARLKDEADSKLEEEKQKVEDKLKNLLR